jgi:glycosyltransferase involved in cell wall biosynthesis
MTLPRLALYDSWHRLRRPAVERVTGPVDVIHATGMAVPPRSVPLVVTVHDLAFRRFPELFTSRGLRFFEASLAITIAEADVVVCPSEATRTDVVSAGVSQDRVRVIGWGVDSRPVDEPTVDRVRRAWRLDGPYVLAVGTIEPRKNLGRLVEAFARIDQSPAGRDARDLDLVIVGPGGWNEAQGDLAASISSAGLSGRVRVLGFVPGADLRALYAGAEAMAYPSLFEGFGLPVLESMAQGTPVVTSSGTATEELVASGRGGLVVDPLDVDAIAAGLVEALDDDGTMGEQARTAAGRYAWSDTASALSELYEELAT